MRQLFVYRDEGTSMQKIFDLLDEKFWIEADGKKINFWVADISDITDNWLRHYQTNKTQMSMEKSFLLKPKLPEKFYYKTLSLKSSINLKKDAMVDDMDGDEWFVESSWYWKDIAFGIGLTVRNDGDLDLRVKTGDSVLNDNLVLGDYYDVTEKDKNDIIFQIYYKNRHPYEELMDRASELFYAGNEKYARKIWDDSFFYAADTASFSESLKRLKLIHKEDS